MRQRGFTIVEVMVAMAVLALVLLASAPSIANWLDNSRIRKTAQSLQTGIETARNEAVRRNENVAFWLVNLTDPSTLNDGCTLSSNSPSWVVSVVAPTGHCGSPSSTTSSPMLVKGYAAGQDGAHVTIAAVQDDGSTAGNNITFNGFGRPVAGAANAISRIDITGTSSSVAYRDLRLTISTAGQVRICDTRVTDSNDPRKCWPS